MTEDECRSKVRCAMSDRTGVLRFESFDIVDAPGRAGTAQTIHRYLVGRALAEADTARIRKMGRDGDVVCARVVAQMVAESQAAFGHAGQLPGSHAAESPRTPNRKEMA